MSEGQLGGEWWQSFFDDDWLALALALDKPEETELEVAAIWDRLELQLGLRLLDVACGHGRHTLPLARRGIAVTGVDTSDGSLASAREAAAAAGVEVEYVRCDMRELPWTGAFDAAIHLFSSFGYFDQQAEDERALQAIARALRPDGLFLIDTVNIVAILRGFTPTDSFELPDGRLLIDQRQYDPRRGRMNDVWTFAGAERHRLESSMRVYTYPELAAMLRRAGLEPVADWGGFDGCEFDLDSFRLQLLARRN